MKKYTADSIVDSLSDGIIAWGEGKTVCCSSAIIEGWRSEDVIVSTYDNAGTWAFSLGKQIAIEDFCDGKDLKDNFVKNWMKRAFQEEYRLSENDYMNIVEEKSLRILSVNFESDRYNFAMVCTVRLNYCYDTFYNQVAPLLSTEEAIELGFIELKEIPSILFSYLQKDQRALYHPSSYLRLLLFYMHRSGVARAERQIVKLDQKMMQFHTNELT